MIVLMKYVRKNVQQVLNSIIFSLEYTIFKGTIYSNNPSQTFDYCLKYNKNCKEGDDYYYPIIKED